MKTDREDGSGQSLVLIALMLVSVMAFLGLIFDVSNAYAQRRWMQNSADAAALAGGRVFAGRGTDNSALMEQKIWTAITTYANKNGTPNSTTAVFITTSGSQVGIALPGNGVVPSTAAGVRVTVNKNFSTFFLGVVSTRNGTVSATAAVLVGPASPPRGMVPIAVPRCYVDPTYPKYVGAVPSICGSMNPHPSTVDHAILGTGAQDPTGTSSWAGLINFRDRLNGTTLLQVGCGDGTKSDASRYILQGGYNSECGRVAFGDKINVLVGVSGAGSGGAADYNLRPQYYSIGMIIYTCIYPEGSVHNGSKQYMNCNGFAAMKITAIDPNYLRAIWAGSTYASAPIDWNANGMNNGVVTMQLTP